MDYNDILTSYTRQIMPYLLKKRHLSILSFPDLEEHVGEWIFNGL